MIHPFSIFFFNFHFRFLLDTFGSIPSRRKKKKGSRRFFSFFLENTCTTFSTFLIVPYKMLSSVRSPSRRWRTHNSHALSAREYEKYQRRPSCYFKKRNTGDTKEKKRKDYGPRRDAPFRMWMFYESRVTGKFMKHASSFAEEEKDFESALCVSV